MPSMDKIWNKNYGIDSRDVVEVTKTVTITGCHLLSSIFFFLDAGPVTHENGKKKVKK